MPDLPASVSRRTAIGGVAAVTAAVAAGCTGEDSGPGTTAAPRRSGPPSPDVALAAAVLVDEQAMLDRVLATARRYPRLAGTLAEARTAHRAHVALLTRAVPEDDRPGSPSASPSVPAAPRRRPVVPADPGAALAVLATAESRLTAVDQRSALAAESGPFARVLASMAAAAAQQAFALMAAAGERR